MADAGKKFTAEGYQSLPEYDPETIERCAQVAENYLDKDHIVVAAIRALKEEG